MHINYLIEVAATSDMSTTDRGRILERFARRFLETQNYKVTEEVRLTATEVDLLCTETTTGERTFVECKAHRQTIPAEVQPCVSGLCGVWTNTTGQVSRSTRNSISSLKMTSPLRAVGRISGP
jgi:hypothetical protein